MSELLKVLSGLRACQHAKGESFINCELKNCPYREYDPDYPCQTRLHKEAAQIITTASIFVPIKSTEEQLKFASELGIYCSEYWCGNCHSMLINHPKYCPECGKMVFWDEKIDL